MKTYWEGAQTTLYCALSPALDGVSGSYFSDCRLKTPSLRARDDDLAERLWRESEKLTGIAQ